MKEGMPMPIYVWEGGGMDEDILKYARKRYSDSVKAMLQMAENARERQRKAEMDKVLRLPGTHPGERFKGDAVDAEFEEVKQTIIL
jgi:hypothetical protein